jgi:serine phosphatase RsbU (regulator of sigma subunit)
VAKSMAVISDLSDEPTEERTMHVRPADRAAAMAALSHEVAHVLVLLSPEQPRRFPIRATAVTIGRVPPSDIVLDDSAVSRRHCRLERAGDDVRLTDLGSTNGTFVDGEAVTGTVTLSDGARVQVGPHVLRYERKRQEDMEAAQSLDRDLAKAHSYVSALLPPPINEGPVQAAWHFQPCATLGGDAFGYQMLGPDWFIAYILDVSGHGVGAAMHSVSVMNVLRQRALPNTDMRDPAAVLAGLNDMFDMETHHGLYFTMWYCSYHLPSRTLAYGSAGHHAGLLCAAAGAQQAVTLGHRHPGIGMQPGHVFATEQVAIAPGNRLYLFSDGAFEIVPQTGPAWTHQTMLDLLRAPPTPGLSEPERLYRAARAASHPGPLDDDFSVLELRFQ